MKRYLFLAAWFDGCESSPDTKNGVHNQDDLMPRFMAGEKEMIKLIIVGAPNEKTAEAYGYRECWHDNMTAHDSVSNLFALDHDGSSTAMYEAQGCKVIKVDIAGHEFDHVNSPSCRCDECWR